MDVEELTTDERLYQLAEKFEEHERKSRRVTDDLFKAQQCNTEAIAQITASVSKLVEDTGDIIRLHRDFQGAARVGNGLQRFMLWLLKWGAIGTGAVAIITWLVDYFSKHSG